MKFVVMIDIDGDFQYVPENPKSFKNFSEPRLFDTIEEAQKECEKWNTGIVLEYGYSLDKIRHMTDEERQRAIVRARKNSVHG